MLQNNYVKTILTDLKRFARRFEYGQKRNKIESWNHTDIINLKPTATSTQFNVVVAILNSTTNNDNDSCSQSMDIQIHLSRTVLDLGPLHYR